MITLSTQHFYSADSRGKAIDVRQRIQGIQSFFPELRFPQKGQTFFYGNDYVVLRHVMKKTAQQKKEWEEANAMLRNEQTQSEQNLFFPRTDLHFSESEVELNVNINHWVRGKIDLTDHPETGVHNTSFINLDQSRSKSDIHNYLSEQSVPWLSRHGIDPSLYKISAKSLKQGKSVSFYRILADHPFLLDYIIDLPEFSHANVIACRVNCTDLAAGYFVAATLFRPESVASVDGYQGMRHCQFELEGFDLPGYKGKKADDKTAKEVEVQQARTA